VAAATSEREAQLTAEAAFNAGQASIVQTITAEAGVTRTADAAAAETTTAIAATETAGAIAAAEPSATGQPAPSATSQPAPSATSQPAPSATSQPAPTRTTGPTRTPAPTSAPSPQPTATSEPGGSVLSRGNGDYFTARVDGPVIEGGASGSCIIGTVRRSGGGLFQSFDVQVSNGRETRRASASFGSGEYNICGLGADTWGVAVYAYDGLDVPSSEEAKHQVRLRVSGASGERFFVHFTARAGIPEPTAVPTVAPTATPFSRFDGTWEGELRGVTGDTSFAGRFAFVIKEGRLLYTGSSGASCAWEDYGLAVAVGEGGFRVGKRVGGNERIYYEAVASFSSATEATGTLYGDDGGGAPCIRDATWTARRTGG
jgi:hypothetical protein